MISAGLFVSEAKKHNFSLYSGVPCSYLKPFINYVIDSDAVAYVGAANEGDAVAIASGAQLAGVGGVAILQSSGLGNAVNPLTSLNDTFRIPILLIITLRGDPQGAGDEPQHGLMGPITTGMLELMGIQWRYFPTQAEDVGPALQGVRQAMQTTGKPYALVMRQNSVAPHALESTPQSRPAAVPQGYRSVVLHPESTRVAMLQAVVAQCGGDRDVVVASTGYCGRELFALDDRANHLYMVGSMGCAASLGLGLALSRPRHRIVVLDGDGAVLMRMGSLATIGYQRPANMLHILFDNEVHESTGGQSTTAHSIDFCAIAHACGYERVERVVAPHELARLLDETQAGLRFIHVKVKPGVMASLPRPDITPPQVAQRLVEFLGRKP